MADERDREAFVAVWGRTAERLHAYFRLNTASEETAIDLTQDVALIAWGGWDGRKDRLLSYFLGIAEKHLLGWYARRRRRGVTRAFESSSGDGMAALQAELTSVSRRAVRRELVDRLAQLAATEDDRDLLIHRGILGWPHERIAALLGIEPSAAKARWSRLVTRLREVLAGDIPEWLALS